MEIAMTVEAVQRVFRRLDRADRPRVSYDGTTLHVPADLAQRIDELSAPLTSADIAPAVRAECDRRVARAFDGKRNSILSYGLALAGKVAVGLTSKPVVTQALTADEQADASLIWAIDAWEGAMIAKREALTASVDLTYADDSHWVAPPAGLTAAWLQGF